MDEIKNWALKSMNDFLRASMEPATIQDIVFYILNIDSPDQAKYELELILGLEIEDHSQQSLLTRSHKLNFIDSYIEKRFAIVSKRKQKPVKVEFSKKNLEKIQKELCGPGFTSKKICYCMARDHDLVGNCLACGKIVCSVEGRGPCLFCGHQVLPKGETPASLPDKSSYMQAIKHKNKLLEYDRNAEERLAVIDDQNDWFDIANNSWLSPEDRQTAIKMAELQKKNLEDAQRTTYVSVNLSTGDVAVDVGSKKLVEENKKENIDKANSFFVKASKNISVNKDLNSESKQIYEQIMQKLQKDVKIREKSERFSIIQNENPFNDLYSASYKPVVLEPLVFSENDDKRQCLTMHQPWASLLIHGFKRVEGREWCTDYRGPLWIHASAKKPSEQEIESVEAQYKHLYASSNAPSFPQSYPTGVLLGRIELTDVMSCEAYKKSLGSELQEENDSKFLFIVKNPMKLLIPIRMQGSKKIYNLDYDTWNGAKNGLRRVSTNY